MKTLHIYPTSRAIRNERLAQKETNGLLPTLMRVDEFEKRATLLPQRAMVDPLQRTLLLQEAAKFEAFEALKINRELVRFFTKSDAIFKFFEELSHEKVTFDALLEGDNYVEFEEHIEILEELLVNYEHLLTERGLIDRAFIPKYYELNQGFIEGYDRFKFHLEGYLSYFELELMEKIAFFRPFIIHMHTSKFNQKVQERFADMGIVLENNAYVVFDLQSKEVLSSEPNKRSIEAEVYAVEERFAQIPLLLESVERMVQEGIPPEEIVVILPDESFKEPLRLYDRLNNFNFAMGVDFSSTHYYKALEAIYRHLTHFTPASKELLLAYGIAVEEVNNLDVTQKISVESLFLTLEPFDSSIYQTAMQRRKKEEVIDSFKVLFKTEQLNFKGWLFLWLKRLSKVTLDDIKGGKVTVMGALETRGVAFRGVVIVDFNDGIVPAIPAKDSFLNSSVRKLAKLPTKNDREALQKQLYKRILEHSSRAVIVYSKSNNKAPASYLYELGLGLGEDVEVNMSLLYAKPYLVVEESDPILRYFDASAITWSATRLKTFLTCKRKYYYEYLLDLKPKEDDELNEGEMIHKLLEHLFKERSYYESKEEMREELERVLDRLLETTNSKIAYSKLLWKAKLEKFIESQLYHFKAGWRVAKREQRIIGSIGGINFKGVVDRIDQDATGTFVLDYKTGSIKEANRTKNLEKLTDFQMSIYSELLKDKHKDLKLAFVEVFEGKTTEITALEEKTELLHEIIGELRATKELVASRCEELTACQYCDYTLLCGRGVYL